MFVCVSMYVCMYVCVCVCVCRKWFYIVLFFIVGRGSVQCPGIWNGCGSGVMTKILSAVCSCG